MRPVDYSKFNMLQTCVNVTEAGSVLVVHEYPLLYYDGETVWRNDSWPTSVAHGYCGTKRQRRVREQRNINICTVIKRCLPMHWSAKFPENSMTFRAAARQAPIHMPRLFASSNSGYPKLTAVELPLNIDMAHYNRLCYAPTNRKHACLPSPASEKYLLGLMWRTMTPEGLVRRQVPSCPWDLPLHRNRSPKESPK
jgi:hypothetical protein